MPMFNYQCQDCGHDQRDKLVKKWDQVVLCPVCHNEMKKLPSCTNFKQLTDPTGA